MINSYKSANDKSLRLIVFCFRYGSKSKGSLLLIVLGVIFLIVVILLIVFIALYAVEKNKDKGELEV